MGLLLSLIHILALVQDLPAIIAGIIKAVPQIVQALVDAFLGLMSKIQDVGQNIVEGIWQGITGAGEWLSLIHILQGTRQKRQKSGVSWITHERPLLG